MVRRGWALDTLRADAVECEREAPREAPRALSMGGREKGVALFQDGEAYRRDWFGEEGVTLTIVSLQFLVNIQVEVESEQWSLAGEKIEVGSVWEVFKAWSGRAHSPRGESRLDEGWGAAPRAGQESGGTGVHCREPEKGEWCPSGGARKVLQDGEVSCAVCC